MDQLLAFSTYLLYLGEREKGRRHRPFTFVLVLVLEGVKDIDS